MVIHNPFTRAVLRTCGSHWAYMILYTYGTRKQNREFAEVGVTASYFLLLPLWNGFFKLLVGVSVKKGFTIQHSLGI